MELWEQHDVWTRGATESLALGLPDVEPVVNRLLRNPADFARALLPYYGAEAANEFGELLREHLVLAADLVKAAKAGDDKAAADIERRWYLNADAIAEFFGGINPYWSAESWRGMLRSHLAMVKAKAVDMLTGQYDSGVAIYDDIESQSLMMADEMAEGIFRQFYAG